MLHPDDPLSPDQGYKPQGWFGNMFGETQSRFANPDGVDESSKQDIIDSEEQWYDGINNWAMCEENAHAMFQEAKDQSLADGSQYVDVDFPPTGQSWCADAFESLAPEKWCRITAITTEACILPQPDEYGAVQPGRVQQGVLKNGFLMEAFTALGTRPALIASCFVASDVHLGLYVIRLYKNAQWTCVPIDDFLPCDAGGRVLSCLSEQFPMVSWAPLLEKAHCRLSFTWTGTEGGTVEEALTDLTGGVCGRFFLSDFAMDRLFVYFYELQNETLWVVRPRPTECLADGLKLPLEHSYAIKRAVVHQGQCYIQLFSSCPVPENGGLGEAVPISLIKEYPADSAYHGYFWVRHQDLCFYFGTCIECRLVNSDSRDGQVMSLTNGPMRWHRLKTPPWQENAPLYEQIWAYQGVVEKDRMPEFQFEVEQAPCELFFCISSVNVEEGYNAIIASLMEQAVDQNNRLHWNLVLKSDFANSRDVTLMARILQPGSYCISTMMPVTGPQFRVNKRLVARLYTSTRVYTHLIKPSREPEHAAGRALRDHMSAEASASCISSFLSTYPLPAHRQHAKANNIELPRWAPRVLPLSFVGIVGRDQPLEYDDAEGQGTPNGAIQEGAIHVRPHLSQHYGFPGKVEEQENPGCSIM